MKYQASVPQMNTLLVSLNVSEYYLRVIATAESVLVCDLTSLPVFAILNFVEVMQEV
jgi:hypothetical protein